jgi:hypothetical protein
MKHGCLRAQVIPGRVLPTIEDLAVMEGRKIRAAFVYSDLHGFSKLVATQVENKSILLSARQAARPLVKSPIEVLFEE